MVGHSGADTLDKVNESNAQSGHGDAGLGSDLGRRLSNTHRLGLVPRTNVANASTTTQVFTAARPLAFLTRAGNARFNYSSTRASLSRSVCGDLAHSPQKKLHEEKTQPFCWRIVGKPLAGVDSGRSMFSRPPTEALKPSRFSPALRFGRTPEIRACSFAATDRRV